MKDWDLLYQTEQKGKKKVHNVSLLRSFRHNLGSMAFLFHEINTSSAKFWQFRIEAVLLKKDKFKSVRYQNNDFNKFLEVSVWNVWKINILKCSNNKQKCCIFFKDNKITFFFIWMLILGYNISSLPLRVDHRS